MFASLVAAVLDGPPRTLPGGYRLVWHDEFDRPGKPDPAKWRFEQGFVRNQELQWYQEDNATVTAGGLVIEGRRERVSNPGYVAGSTDWHTRREFAEYTSSCLETRGIASWLYGRFEVKARFDPSLGMWPAIWFLGVNGEWPRNGEIDLMEFYRSTLLANTAWGDNSWNTVRTPIATFLDRDPNWTRQFHVWRMDWDAKFIRLYVDGRLLNETSLAQTINPDGSNPFHQPAYILLNLAIGATGGDPSRTAFPAKFEVAYVRVYQK